MFNLIIRPLSENSFYIDTMDNYYSEGDIFDIEKYTDIEDIDIQRPVLSKEILFKYNKTDNILGAKFRESFGDNEVGYGDLRASYPVDSGDTLKIEIPFDNMLFERLVTSANVVDVGDDRVTNIMMGSAFKEDLSANNPKPILFFNNGLVQLEVPIKFKGNGSIVDINTIYNISNENDTIESQITDTLNFNTEISPWTYSQINSSLYSNYWENYIANIYNLKQRKYTYKVNLPLNIVHKLSLNDRLNIQDKQYRINDFKIDLTDGTGTFTLFNNFYDAPFDTVVEGIDKTYIIAPQGIKYYDIKLSTNTTWEAVKVGADTSWIELSQESGTGSEVITLKVKYNTAFPQIDREMTINFITNSNTYSLTVKQPHLVIF